MLNLPVMFLRFWFWEAPSSLISFFASLNKAVLELFSLPLIIKTFFKPWKNEYRKGLVGFSRGMGMFIKTFAAVADISIFALLVFLEAVFFGAFLLWPVITILLLLKI